MYLLRESEMRNYVHKDRVRVHIKELKDELRRIIERHGNVDLRSKDLTDPSFRIFCEVRDALQTAEVKLDL